MKYGPRKTKSESKFCGLRRIEEQGESKKEKGRERELEER